MLGEIVLNHRNENAPQGAFSKVPKSAEWPIAPDLHNPLGRYSKPPELASGVIRQLNKKVCNIFTLWADMCRFILHIGFRVSPDFFNWLIYIYKKPPA